MLLSAKKIFVNYPCLENKDISKNVDEVLESKDFDSLYTTDFFESKISNNLYRKAELDFIDYSSKESDSTPIVLVGGIGVGLFDWQDMIVCLGKTNRVVALDLLGIKFSENMKTERVQSLYSQVDVLKQALEKLGLNKAILVGHSMGALVVEAFARVYPDRVEKLVLLDGSFEKKVLEYADSIKETWKLVEVPFFNSVSDLYFRLNNSSLGSKVVSTFMWLPRVLFNRAGLKTMNKVESKYCVDTYSDTVFGNIVVFNRGYFLWLVQLENLCCFRTIETDTLFVAASKNLFGLKSKWVKALMFKMFTFRTENPALDLGFTRVFASHLLMRDVPMKLSKTINEFINGSNVN